MCAKLRVAGKCRAAYASRSFLQDYLRALRRQFNKWRSGCRHSGRHPVRRFTRELGLPGLRYRQIGFRQTIVMFTTNNQITYEDSSHRSKIPCRSKSRKRNLLLVRLREIQDAAFLRRLPQRKRVHTPEGGNHRGQDSGLVLVQAHEESALLRRIAQAALASGSPLPSTRQTLTVGALPLLSPSSE
jgi:hypothetical protein